MTETYDLTNPITDALGDEHTLREVTMTNHSTMTRIEPLTNTEIPAGQTVLVRVLGDIGHEQLISQIQQINELKGFEVIGVTSVVVDGGTDGGNNDGGGNDDTSGALLINCLNQAGKLTYTGGTADFGSIFGEKTAFLFSKPITAGYAFQYENPEPVSGVRAIDDLRIKISSSPDPAYSFFNNGDIFIRLTNPGIGGSGNRFFDVHVKESVGGQLVNEWWYFNEERLRIHVTVNLDSLDIVVTDLVTQETQTHTTNLSGLMAQPMYLHIGVVLSEQASTLDQALIHLPFSELEIS